MILSPLSEVRRKQACPNHLTFICGNLLSQPDCNGSTLGLNLVSRLMQKLKDGMDIVQPPLAVEAPPGLQYTRQ
jgi:hypothetical protein